MPDWMTTGAIFARIAALYPNECPWAVANHDTLDLEYFGNHSGNKIISPLIYDMLIDNDYASELTQAQIDMLAKLIVRKYGKQWEKLYATLSAQYNPIENYNMTEKHTGSDTLTDTPKNWNKETTTDNNQTETVTDTPTDWQKETKTDNNQTETVTDTPTNWKTTTSRDGEDNKVVENATTYGFNSSTPVPKDGMETVTDERTEEEQSGTYEKETTHDGDITVTEEQKGTYEKETTHDGDIVVTEKQTGTYEKETVYDTTTERSGNIGVTTNQAMLQAEVDLWKLWNFTDFIYSTLDEVLTLSVYMNS